MILRRRLVFNPGQPSITLLSPAPARCPPPPWLSSPPPPPPAPPRRPLLEPPPHHLPAVAPPRLPPACIPHPPAVQPLTRCPRPDNNSYEVICLEITIYYDEELNFPELKMLCRGAEIGLSQLESTLAPSPIKLAILNREYIA